MKRFVKEYAAHRVKRFEELFAETNDPNYQRCIIVITNASNKYYQGVITDVDGMTLISHPENYFVIGEA